LLVGQLADTVFADPARGHPVAGFGWAASAFERVSYRDRKSAGAVHTATLVGALAAIGALAQRTARGPVLGAVTAGAIWVTVGGTSLARTGEQLADLVEADDLDGARRLLPSLCGRDPAALDIAGVTRAGLESIAENTSDAHVAPMMWAAVGGVPGAVAYRGINTLDAMIGNKSTRYIRFGWAAARLDDIANYVPARITGLLIAACAPLVGGSASGSLAAWATDAARHPSPNAGVVEASFAGALGIRLGGPTQYHHELEIRPTLGDGRVPQVKDLRRAVRLSQIVQGAATLTAVVGATVVGRIGRRACPQR